MIFLKYIFTEFEKEISGICGGSRGAHWCGGADHGEGAEAEQGAGV